MPSDKNCALRAIWGQILGLLGIQNTAAAFLSLCQDGRSELYKSMVWLSWASLISGLTRQMHSKDDTWVWEMLQAQIWNKMFDFKKLYVFFSTLLDNFFNSVFWSVIHQLRKSFHIYPKNFSLLDWTPLEERAFLYFLFFPTLAVIFSTLGKKYTNFKSPSYSTRILKISARSL